MKTTVIRVGEKNNFNFTKRELTELKKYKEKGKIFLNSNSFVKIKGDFPSFVTINPVLTKFQEPKKGSDLKNVKAFRVKMFMTDNKEYVKEQVKSLKYAEKHNIPVLITFQRYKSIKSALKHSGENFRNSYQHKKGYFRPSKAIQEFLILFAKSKINPDLVKVCDSKGLGCPACKNCARLTYNKPNAIIKALNLSVSGKKDINGNKGKCIFDCPDCFAKLVTFGKRPQCDKLITNKKITGKLKTN